MTLKTLRGRVAFIFDEINFDIDQIVGVKNIKITDIEELAAVAMETYDPDFRQKVKPGDILVGNHNFGYGHPHYPPMRAMRHMGVAGVVSESFSPGYWRGEINMGFPQATCLGILGLVERWDEIEVDYEANEVRNLTRGGSLPIEPLSNADRGTLEAGGLINYIKQREAAAKASEQNTGG